MSKAKTTSFSNPALQQNKQQSVGFNLVTQTNNFNSVFNTQPLEERESKAIESLLRENYFPGTLSDNQIDADVKQITSLTSEIKAIGKQGIVLMGERVFRVRDILKPYRNGTFTRWLESTFGTRKTGYNMLAYYELYNSLPSFDLKENFKKMAPKAAYILASRRGLFEEKANIIAHFYNLDILNLITLIQEKLPLKLKITRFQKDINHKIITNAYDAMKKIHKRKDSLSAEDKQNLILIRNLINESLANV